MGHELTPVSHVAAGHLLLELMAASWRRGGMHGHHTGPYREKLTPEKRPPVNGAHLPECTSPTYNYSINSLGAHVYDALRATQTAKCHAVPHCTTTHEIGTWTIARGLPPAILHLDPHGLCFTDLAELGAEGTAASMT